MTALAWTTVKNALQAWLVTSTGLATERVYYAGQNIPRPVGDAAAVALRVVGIAPVGRAAVTQADNPGLPAGAELIKTYSSYDVITMTCTCFPPKITTDATEAHALLHEAVKALDLPTRRAALVAAGIGALKTEPITPIDGIINSTRFEPRAVFTFTFVAPSSVSETITNIESVNTETDTTSPAKVFTFAVNLDP